MNGLRVNALHYYVNFILVVFVDSAISSIVRNPPLDVQTRQILMRHNFYRQIHESEPLTLDTKLCEEALELAQSMAETDQLMITSGINVFSEKLDDLKSDGEVAYLNPVDSWYQEVLLYRDEETKELTRNFTQMVWNASQRLGVGIARSESDTFYVACKYDPPGNIDNAYEHNVFKRRGDDDWYHEQAVRSDLGELEAPLFPEQPKTNLTDIFYTTDREPARDMDSIVAETSSANTTATISVRSRIPDDRARARIHWWLIFESVARTLADEVRHFIWPESDAHSIEKREINLELGKNVEETMPNDLDSLLHAASVESVESLMRSDSDPFADTVAKVYGGECCEEEKDPCIIDDMSKKCSCQRLTQMEIVSRKVDMVLVFVVFNNIFMIIFGVAVTLGVVVQWCTGPGMNKRRR